MGLGAEINTKDIARRIDIRETLQCISCKFCFNLYDDAGFYSSEPNITSLCFMLKVMTPNPECASIDTPIVDALHTMHDGKFLHLPVVDRGNVYVILNPRNKKRFHL